MSCTCGSKPCSCQPVTFCEPENFGLKFPSLVGPAGPPGGPGTYVSSLAALRLVSVGTFQDGYIANVLGYGTPNDGGQGLFSYNTTSVLADNDGTIVTSLSGIGRWERINGTEISPEMFGMTGDGVTDDYAKWQRLVAWLNLRGGGTINFTPGKVYFFGVHIVAGNGVVNTFFQSQNGIILNGNGATIKVQGNFTRAVNTTNTLCGLIFYDCSNVEVRDLILDGNSNTIVKSGVPSEGFVYGLYLGSCNKVKVSNVTAQYWITDGFGLNISEVENPRISNREVNFLNCVALYNARQGLTIDQCYGGLFENCVFSYSGRGSYGLHAPAAGVDIEPDRFMTTGAPNQMDVNTGELQFIRCTFLQNAGCTVTSSSPAFVHNVSFQRCRFEVGLGNVVSAFGFINDMRNVIYSNCYFDMADRGLYLSFTPNSSGYINFIGNTVLGKAELIRNLNESPMWAQDNRFIATWTAPQTGFAIYITNAGAVFVNNYVFLPKEGYLSDGAGGRAIRMQLIDCRICSGNKYETDLQPDAAGGGGTAHYANGYTDGPLFGVRNEIYVGTDPGPNDTIRPAYNRNSDTTFPFSFGTTHAGDFLRVGEQEKARNITYSDAVPAAGFWTKGDIVLNNSAVEGGVLGWYCTISGTPGTWKTLPKIGTMGTAMAYRIGNLSIADSVETPVPWSAVWYDDLGIWSGGANTLLTVPAGAKRVRVSAGVRWASSGTGYRSVRIKSSNPLGIYPLNATWAANQNLAALVPVISGSCTLTTGIIDVQNITSFNLTVEQTSGGPLDLIATPGTFFQMEVIE